MADRAAVTQAQGLETSTLISFSVFLCLPVTRHYIKKIPSVANVPALPGTNTEYPTYVAIKVSKPRNDIRFLIDDTKYPQVSVSTPTAVFAFTSILPLRLACYLRRGYD